MRTDLRIKHDIETRRAAVELFRSGRGCDIVSGALSVPRTTVRQWQRIYRAFGSEVLLRMDGKQAVYTYEQRLAAATAPTGRHQQHVRERTREGFRRRRPWEKLSTGITEFKVAGAKAYWDEGDRSERHIGVQSMSRKVNCIDNAATEQLFGHVKDEFDRGRQ